MNDNRFPKAALLTIRYRGFKKILKFSIWSPLYARMANASILYFGPFEFSWRMPWLPHAAAAKGWDECWRQMYPEIAALKQQLEKADQ